MYILNQRDYTDYPGGSNIIKHYKAETVLLQEERLSMVDRPCCSPANFDVWNSYSETGSSCLAPVDDTG